MDIKRLFLVGCPRSGTTLLQSMLVGHSKIVSFPETRFFPRTLPINPLLRRLKLYGSKSRAIVQEFLEENDCRTITPFKDSQTSRWVTHNTWCRELIEVIDQIIRQKTPDDINHETIWGLEKSPRHLHYVSSIDQARQENKYLHLLRYGPDVVASMYLVTNRYPEQWNGKRSVRKCIQWWNHSMRASLKYCESPNHFFVVYDQLVKSPEKVLQPVCNFLHLNYQKSMIDNFAQTAEVLTNADEDAKWHKRNKSQSLSKSNKLEKHFDSSAIRYIKKKTFDVDFTQFYH